MVHTWVLSQNGVQVDAHVGEGEVGSNRKQLGTWNQVFSILIQI